MDRDGDLDMDVPQNGRGRGRGRGGREGRRGGGRPVNINDSLMDNTANRAARGGSGTLRTGSRRPPGRDPVGTRLSSPTSGSRNGRLKGTTGPIVGVRVNGWHKSHGTFLECSRFLERKTSLKFIKVRYYISLWFLPLRGPVLPFPLYTPHVLLCCGFGCTEVRLHASWHAVLNSPINSSGRCMSLSDHLYAPSNPKLVVPVNALYSNSIWSNKSVSESLMRSTPYVSRKHQGVYVMLKRRVFDRPQRRETIWLFTFLHPICRRFLIGIWSNLPESTLQLQPMW